MLVVANFVDGKVQIISEAKSSHILSITLIYYILIVDANQMIKKINNCFDRLRMPDPSCSTLISSVTQGFAEDLSVAILESEDLEMVRDGAPAYLILLDGLISNSPDDKFLLRQLLSCIQPTRALSSRTRIVRNY